MFANVLRFLYLIVTPRPSFSIPHSEPEPFHQFNIYTSFASNGSCAAANDSHTVSFASANCNGSGLLHPSFSSASDSRYFTPAETPLSISPSKRKYFVSDDSFLNCVLNSSRTPEKAESFVHSPSSYRHRKTVDGSPLRSVEVGTTSLRRRKGHIVSKAQHRQPSVKKTTKDSTFHSKPQINYKSLQRNSRPCFELSPIVEDRSSISSKSFYSCSSCESFSSSEISQDYGKLCQMDRSSGVVFEKVYESIYGQQPENMDLESPSHPSCVLSSRVGVGFDGSNPGHALSAIPSLMLTLPTPDMGNSPVFAPQSPFTIAKFVAASASSEFAAPSSSLRGFHQTSSTPAPPLPTCVRCDLSTDSLCHACEQQWLACKLWFHSKNTSLKEPLVKPAESNRCSRETMKNMGLAVGSPKGLGIELGDELKRVSRSMPCPSIPGSHAPREADPARNRTNGSFNRKRHRGMKLGTQLGVLWSKVSVFFRSPFHLNRKPYSSGVAVSPSETAQGPQPRKLLPAFRFRGSETATGTSSVLGTCGIRPLAADLSPLCLARPSFCQDDTSSSRSAFVKDVTGSESSMRS